LEIFQELTYPKNFHCHAGSLSRNATDWKEGAITLHSSSRMSGQSMVYVSENSRAVLAPSSSALG